MKIWNIKYKIHTNKSGYLLQAEDRVHRIGQQNASNIHYIIGENTIDDVLWPMISKKLEVLGETLNGQEQKMDIHNVAEKSGLF